MKKTLVAALLGVAVSAATSYGQGSITFQTYTSHGGSGLLTTFAPGTPGYSGDVTPAFTVGLAYSLAPIVDGAGVGDLLGGWTIAPNTAVFGPPGYWLGQNFVLNPYTAGTTVYFQVFAWETVDGSYANADIRGKSAVFTQVLATGIDAPGDMNNMQAWTVGLVPEPSTLALGGLGLASLLAFRRRS